MQVPGNSNEHSSPSVGLLISVLVRYPEIVSLQYDHIDQALRFALMIAKRLPECRVEDTERRIVTSLDAYLALESRKPAILDVETEVYDEISVIQMRRDVATLTREEIWLVTEIVKELFPGELVSEHGEAWGDEDPAFQEEMIEEMLDNLRHSEQQKNLVAFREEGRVLVYNK